tara:strand:- start:553 stop:1488 length:936 start_codon:yes stop_codon:yes gene_type:complete
MNPIKLKIDFDIAQKEIPIKWPSFFNMGSCFAENQSSRLTELGFSLYSNPFGIIYNPVSIKKILCRITDDNKYISSDFKSVNGYFSLEHHGSFKYELLENAIDQSNSILNKTKEKLKQTDICIITLGTSLVYQYDYKIVANCHRLPTKDFQQVQLTHQQVLNSIASITNCFKSLNKNIHITFTVSPIRHLRSGVIENSRSKAVLISAIHDFTESGENTNTSYFPAYEIFIDELRDYRFSNEDFVHPTKQAQDYIWDRFCDTYFSKNTKTIISSVKNYTNFKNHRPIKLEPYQEKLDQMKKQLIKTYPFLSL